MSLVFFRGLVLLVVMAKDHESKWKCTRPPGLGLELTHPYFCCTVLPSHMAESVESEWERMTKFLGRM